MPGFPTPINVVGVSANRRDPTNRGEARRYKTERGRAGAPMPAAFNRYGVAQMWALMLMPTSKLTDPKGQLTFASEREHPRRKHSALKWTDSPTVLGCAPHHRARSAVRERPLPVQLQPTRKHRRGPREQHGRQDRLL